MNVGHTYRPPIDQLLTLDVPADFGERDYLALGLRPEHIPELIRLATDEPLRWSDEAEEPALWGPIHAWYALGQLRAEAAIEPLLSQFRHVDVEDDDWVQEEMPAVFAHIGPAAVPALAAYLAEVTHGVYALAAAGTALSRIGARYPEALEACAAGLIARLERFEDNDIGLNAFLIGDLLDLKAREAAPLMERAFARERVDEMVCGDWEDVQIELGLKAVRERPRRPNPWASLLPPLWRDAPAEARRPVPEHVRQWNEQVEARRQAEMAAKAEQLSRRHGKKRRRGRKK
jgi:hypothetical protein